MSLDGAYDPQNPFARVLRGELPAAKVFEDAEVLAFMDLYPQSRGHVLVISKGSQARNLLDVDPGHLTALALGVQRVARAVRAALRPDGIVVTQFSGAEAGQTVFHLHVHVIPRYAGQPLGRHGAGGPADAGELAALARAIADEIS
jgi:histidine triad (HIT) family protein